jgi:ABC-type uncharacterized transport system ATPase subunit
MPKQAVDIASGEALGLRRQEARAARVISMRSIVKRFGPVVANDSIDFDVSPGQIHALAGQNGAGKTTLMRILFGELAPDSGQIVAEGQAVSLASPRDALDLGIGMVHQNLMLVPDLTVAENVVLGSRALSGLRLRTREIDEEVRALSGAFGLEVDPRRPVGSLSIDLQQRVEILKLLYRGVTTLILDEPTAVLGPKETELVFAALRDLKATGRSVVIISHKLSEVVEIADRVTVLRHGRVVSVADRGSFDEAKLALAMLGTIPPVVARPTPPTPVAVGLSSTAAPQARLVVEGVTVLADNRRPALDGLSMQVWPGEVVGVAGVEGNGQQELSQALAGLRPLAGGRLLVSGRALDRADPRSFRQSGLSVITEDRLTWDLALDLSLADNLAMARVAGGEYRRGALLDRPRIRRDAEALLRRFGVVPPDPDLPAWTLSGGNQQKLVLARELGRRPDVLIVSQPTRGLDVEATRFVQGELLQLRAEGCAIVLITHDLDELLEVSDRVLVLYRGKIAYEARSEEASVDHIADAMAGLRAGNVA